MPTDRRTEILWLSHALESAERCVIDDYAGPRSIMGTAVLSMHGVPASIIYEVDTAPDWSTAAARVTITTGAGSQTVTLEASADGWLVDGTARPELGSCTTVDLGWSPATNTLPLRATELAVGESVASVAAWLRFPELDVVASEQTYTRLASDRVRYGSATFTADLAITEHQVVTMYGDGLWSAARVHRSGNR